MNSSSPDDKLFLLLRAMVVVVSMAIAILLGFWLGGLSVPNDLPVVPGTNEVRQEAALEDGRESYVDPEAPPFYLYLGARSEQDWLVAGAQAALAANVGQHQYIVPIAIPWPGSDGLRAAEMSLAALTQADAEASFLLELDLNPPADWYTQTGLPPLTGDDAESGYPSLASPAWRRDVETGMAELVAWLARSDYAHRVIGFVLAALEDGRWIRSSAIDTSAANGAAFRTWLTGIYGSDAAFSEAWGSAWRTVEDVQLPDLHIPRSAVGSFLDLEKDRPYSDFIRFSSEYCADTIAHFAVLLREGYPNEVKIYANYGYSLELESNLAGHHALNLLLNSDLNGFISPVSYVDRGLGGAGGFMGPVNSALYHDKEWLILDDTRTGVSKDPLSGEIGRLRGLRAEDVYSVQRRNFAAAAVHGLGVVWADPRAEGWLHDAEQWEVLANLRGIYSGLYGARGDLAGGEGEDGQEPTVQNRRPDLVVVVSERARYLQHEGAGLNAALLQGSRDAALRAGVSTQFAMLEDVLEDRSPPATAYLFLNAFELSESQRTRLHERLTVEQACAIWLYAPGYFDGQTASVDNISKTVMMNVRAFDGPQLGGSAFKLAGGWIKAEESFGTPSTWDPLFYIEDDEVDLLAEFQAVKRTSAGIRFLPEGWASVFVAEPSVSPGFLRELFRILEYPTFFRPSARSQLDTVHMNETLLMIHGRQTGEVSFNLPDPVSAVDLFDPEIGWTNLSSFLMPFKTGETRLLQFLPPEVNTFAE